jgi:mono/diheme cytochrome c family protein
MRTRQILLLLILGGIALLSGCAREDDAGFSETSTPSNDFLLYPNSHAGVGVGDYRIDIFKNSAPPSGQAYPIPYSVTVTHTNGTTQVLSGTWTTDSQFNILSFEVTSPGGITLSMNSGGFSTFMGLYLVNATQYLAVVGSPPPTINTTPLPMAVNPSISLPRFQIDQAAYANAYYAVVDPTNQKLTLANWKSQNGFSGANCNPVVSGTAVEYEIRIHDQHDLGYGRHMCARRNILTGDVAVWVENFQVKAIPGQDYGQLNLEAVVNGDYRWHIGTNAIEYSATPSSGGVKFVKFYTFNPDGTRRTLVDLDGKGAKAMPVPCVSCHGGTAWPLQTVWNAGTSMTEVAFPRIVGFPRADVRAQMQPLDVGGFGFSPVAGYRQQDQEASLKGINQIVLCTYPLAFGVPANGAEDGCRVAATLGAQWQSGAAEMIKAWYGGNGMPGNFSDTYVPTGWTNGQTAPVSGETVPSTPDATNLYRTVVARNCRVCHVLRGNANGTGATDIDFLEFQKFIGGAGPTPYPGYASRIKYHVFERGNMPLALLKYEQFWESGAPMTLAALIAGALDSNGNVLTPTRPVAKPGPDRTIVRGVATKLSAADSVNATSYLWEIVTSPVGSTPSLTNANIARPTFSTGATASDIGTYTIRLTVSDGSASSAPAILTLYAAASLVDGSSVVTVANPAAINFTQVRSILQSGSYPCTGCHFGPATDGPPIHYNDYDRVGIGGAATGAETPNRHQLYLDVRARVNFNDVVSSRILQRPSGNHHPGGLLTNFDSSLAPGSAGRGAYDIFLHWILNGATE